MYYCVARGPLVGHKKKSETSSAHLTSYQANAHRHTRADRKRGRWGDGNGGKIQTADKTGRAAWKKGEIERELLLDGRLSQRDKFFVLGLTCNHP